MTTHGDILLDFYLIVKYHVGMTDVPSQTDTYFFEEEGEMTISLKVAAGRLLEWNKRGREIATPRRGLWVHRRKTGKCLACKIGLVMIGRYGVNKVLGDSHDLDDSTLLDDTLHYGPKVVCPVDNCLYLHDRNYLGFTIERLFESHKWSVNRIDKWLAGLAEEDND